MNEQKLDAKERILQAAIALLLEHKSTSAVTNRQIAEKAGVNSALINYYYQSKENLINKAAAMCIEQMTGALFENNEGGAPEERLRNLIKTITDFLFDHYDLGALTISADLKTGSLTTVRTLLPILREHYQNSKTEDMLKLIALQIVAPLQVIFLNLHVYRDFLGVDVFEKKERDRVLDTVIDNALQCTAQS